jgi:hypothetical protein
MMIVYMLWNNAFRDENLHTWHKDDVARFLHEPRVLNTISRDAGTVHEKLKQLKQPLYSWRVYRAKLTRMPS